MEEFSLISSQKKFNAFEAPEKHYVNLNELLSYPEKYANKVNLNGFIVVKDVFNIETINKLRNNYYNLFSDEYEFKNNCWNQIKDPEDPHGYGNHPVKNFLKSKEFLSFVNNSQLKKIASILLGSKKALLSKRILVRSFSSCSTFTTKAHRDQEYYVSSDSSKAITAWIPIGPADKNHGQLIYLENSQKFSFSDKSKKNKVDRIISSDLSQLAFKKSSRWLIPEINIGDILFHSLLTVHASFESTLRVPRLSCDLRFAASKNYEDPRWNSHWYGEDGL
ncbi:phytanoyl-CoA dioxygenase family protein [Prochlorococcus sp. AH-716-K03]|nr:phytanoyl-CoA dioxygenase family protein [Prochlorococcus sp. AH-716-K03]